MYKNFKKIFCFKTFKILSLYSREVVVPFAIKPLLKTARELDLIRM